MSDPAILPVRSEPVYPDNRALLGESWCDSRLKNGLTHFCLRPEFVFSLDLLDVAALDHLGEDTLIQKFLDIELADLGIA